MGAINKNAHADAIKRVRMLPVKLRTALRESLAYDLAQLKQCKESHKHWNQLALGLNIAQLLSVMGICSDDESLQLIKRGVAALHAIRFRVDDGASWTLRADEIRALGDAIERHAIQLEFVSAGEFARARDAVLKNNERSKSLPVGSTFYIRKA